MTLEKQLQLVSGWDWYSLPVVAHHGEKEGKTWRWRVDGDCCKLDKRKAESIMKEQTYPSFLCPYVLLPKLQWLPGGWLLYVSAGSHVHVSTEERFTTWLTVAGRRVNLELAIDTTVTVMDR